MFCRILLIAAVVPAGGALAGDEKPIRAKDTKERFVLDDMESVSGWQNGSPDETTISASPEHVKQGRCSLKFANVVDHTKGETNYPVGWPRVGKDLAKAKRTDWSDYDFFECWIYAETSRQSLPGVPLGVGFYHSGRKQSTHRPLKEVTKDAWVKIVIPVAELAAPADVQRVQFNISEADYKHGDRVDFYIDDMALTRFVELVVAEFSLERKVLYSGDPAVAAVYKLAGRKGIETATVELAVGRGAAEPVARTQAKATRQGELSLALGRALTPGLYWGRLGLRDANGRLIDQKSLEFRVIGGPF
jgi:hypothetical protein